MSSESIDTLQEQEDLDYQKWVLETNPMLRNRWTSFTREEKVQLFYSLKKMALSQDFLDEKLHHRLMLELDDEVYRQ